MAKNFAPRVSKRSREKVDLTEKLGRDIFTMSDDKLLRGARLEEIELKDVIVKEQVRTKFNDSSIKELAKNIETNGLIQPLVIHREGAKYTLICGERRFRAMTSIKMKKCPCFILENKNAEELMAIQFSENSAREALHYIDRADGILNYQKATKASERKIVAALGISKTEVHRSLLIAKLPVKVKEAAKNFNIEKYVLIELSALEKGSLRKKIQQMVINGEIIKRSQLKKVVSSGGIIKAGKSTRTRKTTKKNLTQNVSASAFLKAMEVTTKDMKLDKKTKALLKQLVNDTKEVISE